VTVAYLQNPKTAKTDWGREYPTRASARAAAPTYVYAAAGTATVMLGLLFGAVVATFSGAGIGAPPSGNPNTFSASVSGTNNAPVAEAATVQTFQSAQDDQTPTGSSKAATSAASSHVARTSHKAFINSSLASNHGNEGTSAAGKSEKTDTSTFAQLPPPPAVQPVDEAPRPAVFMIEGDVTVADYDATAGKIETQEGKTFSISTAAANTVALTWQDSTVNVHYRCDQGGNCTLIHGGVVLTNARLAI
jgi:hypothetical protein